MKDAIKMYHLFFPRKWWMVLVYVLYPAVVSLFGLWCFNIGPVVGTMISLMLTTSVMICAEYILDVYMLFGIVAKENRSLEYIKSSSKGVNLLKVSLYVDGVRRIVTTTGIFALVYAITRYNFEHVEEYIAIAEMGGATKCPSIIVYIQCVVIVLLLTEAGLIFTRQTKNVLINLVLLYLLSAISCPFAMAAAEFANILTVIISVVVLSVIWMAGRRFLIKKVRMSFYDEGYKELFQTT